MTKNIAILHYAGPPVIGGVESMIEHQARGLTDLGYIVRVICGVGQTFDPRIKTYVNPLFGSTQADVLTVKAELDVGNVSSRFYALVEQIATALQTALDGCTVCIAHNVPSLNKNLPLTAALAQLAETGAVRVIAWCSDLAATNPQYQPELHPGYPWDLLRQPWKAVPYITISEPRRFELAEAFGINPESVAVIPPGIDPALFFRWRPTTERIVRQLELFDSDGLLLLPARLTRRKNIALGLHVLAAIRALSSCDFRLIVTGPPGPHNPTNPGYLGELLDLRRVLDLENAAHFLYECGEDSQPLLLDDDTIADLYRIADALFFPSIQEGFGIPMLEAGLTGLPIFCADIPPLRATGGGDATYFDPIHEPPEQIAARVLTVLEANPAYHLRGRVRLSFRWDVLIRDQIVPLLEVK
jgi:mannosylglucosylglycerate synthase